jgi:catechol O-methyltransferase
MGPADIQHLFEAHPDSKYPAEWSETDEPGTRAGYVSLEKSEVYAKTAQGAFDLAGLGKVVKVSPILFLFFPTRLGGREMKARRDLS